MSRQERVDYPITQVDFHGHHFNDACPHEEVSLVTVYKRKLGNALKRRLLGKVPLEQVGLKAVREFILTGGTQSDPLATFYTPAVFELSKYNPGTVVRLHHEYYFRSALKSYVSGYFNEEYRKSQESLGIVLADGKRKTKRLLVLRDSEAEIMASRPARLWLEDEIALGEWIHRPFKEGIVFPGHWSTEVFHNFGQIEILTMGKASREKATQKAVLTSPQKQVFPVIS